VVSFMLWPLYPQGNAHRIHYIGGWSECDSEEKNMPLPSI